MLSLLKYLLIMLYSYSWIDYKKGHILMQNIVLLLFFFLLNGCTSNRPFLADEVDKVYVVRHDSYLKHHRAYFTRTNLEPIRSGQKYLYLYHAKEKNLVILLHRKEQYLLYSLTYPDKKEIIFNAGDKTRYSTLLKNMEEKGYIPTSPSSMGYISKVTLQQYKGIKTLLVEVKDYSRLQNIYKKAIKTYDAKDIRSIKTKLPKELISSYYEYYHKRARTQKQLKELQIIAIKLQLDSAGEVEQSTKQKPKTVPAKLKAEDPGTAGEVQVKEERAEEAEVVEVVRQPSKATKPYAYYLESATQNELDIYLSEGGAQDHLTYNQYHTLKTKLKKEELLQDGSLEDLITAYQKDKDPRYKTKILLLMKKEHKE